MIKMATTTPRPVQKARPISAERLEEFRARFDEEPRNRQSMNAVTTTPVHTIAKDRRVVSRMDHIYSHHLPEAKATSQNGSGRCWLFAALNTMRFKAIQDLKLPEEWELSQSYLMFYDKLEKANYFLEAILQTLDEPVGSRLLDWLLASPIQDGGQWHMFTSLVKKYGVVPKSVYPESESSSSTGQMNGFITAKLREFAAKLRARSEAGATREELEREKDGMMEEVYRFLSIHNGEPPKNFSWQYRDKDKNFVRDENITPQKFYEKYIGQDLDDMVCLIHSPQPGKKFNTLYTIRFLGNVVGGDPIHYLNVDIDILRDAASKQIQDGKPVWFGCDVGKYLDRDAGIMDTDLFQYDLVYGSHLEMNKAERLDYGQSLMTHAMVLTGVDLDAKGHPTKWRVENSWGEKVGDKGFLSMSDPWFDEFLYEVVVDKSRIPAKLLPILEQEPVELEPWDPMGSLAV